MEYVYLVWDLQPGQLAGPRKLKHGMVMVNGVPAKIAKPVAPRVMRDYRAVRPATAADFTAAGLEVPEALRPAAAPEPLSLDAPAPGYWCDYDPAAPEPAPDPSDWTPVVFDPPPVAAHDLLEPQDEHAK